MPSRLLLGAIADDVTGGSDMAGMLAEQGVRTVQTFGLPDDEVLGQCKDAEAVIVSQKTRSIPARDAVRLSLEALKVLDARQIQFKYCSTFDSTAEGNIGPVASALMDELGVSFTIAVPALPVNGRRQYCGHLFVNGVPLAESHMRHHPLNPMTDSNLVRHLQAQTSRPVTLIDLHELHANRFDRHSGIALVDAIDTDDLDRIARLFVDLPLITGGSGISGALPEAWRETYGWNASPRSLSDRQAVSKKALLLAGSCSTATMNQVERWRMSGYPLAQLHGGGTDELLDWAGDCWHTNDAVLIYSSAPLAERTESAAEVEGEFARIAAALAGNYGRLVVAGGETAGAVIDALGIRAVEIGAVIDPGVPVLRVISGPPLKLALKSGNVGVPHFFEKALHALE